MTIAGGAVVTQPTGLFGSLKAAAGAFRTSFFGPNDPPPSDVATQAEGPRQFQYVPGYNLRYAPRASEGLTDFGWLINIADLYDTLRMCINYRIEEIAALDWEIVPKDVDATVSDAQLTEARQRVEYPDGRMDWESWMAMAVEETLVTDALTISLDTNRRGDVLALNCIDGALWRPLADAHGRVPRAPSIAYQQWYYGKTIYSAIPMLTSAELKSNRSWLDTAGEILYLPKNLRTRSLYGRSPTEELVLTINRALRRQMFDLSFYSDGNIPEGIVGLPDFSPDQTEQLQNWFDNIIAQQPNKRRRLMFLPAKGDGGLDVHEFKPPINDPVVEEHLDQRCMARMGVTKQELGFTNDANRSTAAGQENVQLRRRLPLMRFYARMWTRLLDRMGYPALEFRFLGDTPSEDKLQQAQVDDIYLRNGKVSIDELRERDGEELLGVAHYFATSTGPVPLLSGLMAADAENQDTIDNPNKPMVLMAPANDTEDGGGEDAGAADEDDDVGESANEGPEDVERRSSELRAWHKWAAKRLKSGDRLSRSFRFDVLDHRSARYLDSALQRAQTRDDLADARDRVQRALDTGDDASGPGNGSARAMRVAGFGAAVAALLLALKKGSIGMPAFEQRFNALWQQGVSAVTADAGAAYDVPDPARVIQGGAAGQVMSKLGQVAATFAMWAASQVTPDATNPQTGEAVPGTSVAQLAAWGNQASGPIHAAHFVADGAAQDSTLGTDSQLMGTWAAADDEQTCNTCGALDGQTWPIDGIPQYPGDGQTDCFGNCRCEIEFATGPGEVTVEGDHSSADEGAPDEESEDD